ncbi:MAG: HPr family phosphocarrier protein [Gammaproteobacteria bacterium]|nr:MAG: HPr family phosphocarrier protein [Gammaproteobacteria bacterium]
MSEISRPVSIINKLGMHARAAAKFVNIASGYQSHVEIERNGQRVNGKSIMGVMMLAAAKGTEIVLHVKGDDAENCVNALESLINNKFDEGE